MNTRAITALCMLSLVNFLENYMRTLISVSIIPFLNYDSYNYSLLSGTFFAVMYTCGGLFFSLSPALHSKRVLSIAFACFVFSLATFATALSTSVGVLILIRMVMGLGQSVVTPFASGIIGAYFSRESRGIAFSLFNFGTYASFSLSLSLGTFMYDEYGWKSGYMLFGIMGMSIGLVMPLIMTDKQIPLLEKESDDEGVLCMAGGDGVSQPLLLPPQGRGGGPSVDRVSSVGSYYEIEEDDDGLYEESFIGRDVSLFSSGGGGAPRVKVEKSERGGGSTSSSRSQRGSAGGRGSGRGRGSGSGSISGSGVGVSIIQTLAAVLRCWRSHPLLIVTCLATGVRLGAGYVWTSYTAIYFSELYLVEDRDDNCLYSSPSLSATSSSSSSSSASYHQQDPLDASFLRTSTTCGSDYPYCFSAEGECRKLNDYPWHNRGLEHVHLQEYMSWVPLVGSGFGSLVGGHVSDKMNAIFGLKGRPLVAGVSSLVSIPFVVLALSSGFPACFLYFIPSGLTGEMYIGASLALVADLTPPPLLVPSTALFMFVVTIIAGNCPLLVPLGLDTVISKTYHTFTIAAAPQEENVGTEYVEYTVSERSGRDLQQVMIVLICALYAVSSIIYFLVMLLCPAAPPPTITSTSSSSSSSTLASRGKKIDPVVI